MKEPLPYGKKITNNTDLGLELSDCVRSLKHLLEIPYMDSK